MAFMKKRELLLVKLENAKTCPFDQNQSIKTILDEDQSYILHVTGLQFVLCPQNKLSVSLCLEGNKE